MSAAKKGNVSAVRDFLRAGKVRPTTRNRVSALSSVIYMRVLCCSVLFCSVLCVLSSVQFFAC
jgi:hypothetical protein